MAITPEEATDLHDLFINQLVRTGYSRVVQQVNVRLERRQTLQELSNAPFAFLMEYMTETCKVLDSLSNKSYDALLYRLGKHIKTNGDRVTGASIETVIPETAPSFDLRSTPDYEGLINDIYKLQDVIYNLNKQS